uniref:Ig-like domain-containing protein n=1 Tax=Callorhinchus milii TaxID=7868 RepID=A0A4W3GXA4_CALMI
MPDEDNRLRNVLNITANKSDDGQNYTCVAEIILESNNTMQIQTSSVTLQVNCKFLFSHKKNGNSPFLSVNQLCICLFSCVNLFFFDKLTDAPTVGINKASEDWVEGKPQTVSCDVTGSPAPRLTWTKDGKPLSRERTLHIQSVHMDDAGLYTCTATNKYGSTNYSLNVTIMTPESPIQINNGDNVTLTCFSEANPSANLSWEYPHQSTNVKEYPSGILFISYANSGNSGIYKCRANNHHGTDVQKVEISVNVEISVKVLGFLFIINIFIETNIFLIPCIMFFLFFSHRYNRCGCRICSGCHHTWSCNRSRCLLLVSESSEKRKLQNTRCKAQQQSTDPKCRYTPRQYPSERLQSISPQQ